MSLVIILAITWGVVASILLEQARVAARSISDSYNSKSPLQPLFDLIKIFGKEEKIALSLKIAVVFKFISLLGLLLLVPVYLIYPALEPRLNFALFCVLLILPALLDVTIDALSLKSEDSIDRFAFSKNGLLIALIFLLAISGKYVLEIRFDQAFPESTGFPFLLSPALALTGVMHTLFGIVAVISLALFDYRLENFKRPAFAVTPGIPSEWPVGFTGPFLGIDVLSADVHRFACLSVVVHFFFSPFNGSIPVLITNQTAVAGIIVGFLINAVFLAAILLSVSHFRRNKLDYLSLISRRRFTARVLVPLLLISYALVLIY